MSRRTDASSPSGGLQFATGTYTGDGAATQIIIGVGFQPKFVWIWRQVDIENDIPAMKADVDGLFAELWLWNVGHGYKTDMIISLDADGFTVGDGTGYGNVLNTVGQTYTYNCWR